MGIYQIQKINSIEYCEDLFQLSKSVAAETYKRFSNQSVLNEWLKSNTSEEVWRERIQGEKSAVYGAFFEDSLIGSVWATARQGIHNTDSYIGGLYVAASGQGVATSLLDHSELRLAAWGCKSILVDVAENSPAIKLFTGREYKKLGSHPGRNFKNVSWAEMRKLLVQSTSPCIIDKN